MIDPEMNRLCDEMFAKAKAYKGPSIEEATREMQKTMDLAFPKSGVSLVEQHKAEWAALQQEEMGRIAQTEAALKAARDARIAKVKSECSPTQWRAVELLVDELAERGKFTPAEVADGNAYTAGWILIQNGWISQVM